MAEKGLWKRVRPLLILLVVAAAFWGGQLLRGRLDLDLSVEDIQEWISQREGAAFAVFFLLVVFRIVILIPSQVLIPAGGACFGVFWGTALGSAGILVSALLQFAIGRGVGREWVRKRLGDKAPEIERRIRSGGPFVLALVTAHPLGIMTLFHWASGFSSMRLVPFAFAVGIGAIFRAFSLSLFGATLVEVGSAKLWLATGILAVITIISLAHPGLRRCMLRG